MFWVGLLISGVMNIETRRDQKRLKYVRILDLGHLIQVKSNVCFFNRTIVRLQLSNTKYKCNK